MTSPQPNPSSDAGKDAAVVAPEPVVVAVAVRRSAQGKNSPSSPDIQAHTEPRAATTDFVTLRIWAETLEDVMKARISVSNRIKNQAVDLSLFAGDLHSLKAREESIALSLRRAARELIRDEFPSVEEWARASFGIGMDRLLPRLLGHLGHPVVAYPYAWMDEAPDGHECDRLRCGEGRHLVAFEPFQRSLRQLWQYCGHGAPVRRSKGMSQDEALRLGSPRCKMLVHLMAEATIKCGPQPVAFAEAKRVSAGATDSSPPRVTSKAINEAAGSSSDSGTGPRRSTEALIQPDRYRYRHVYDARRAVTQDREGWTPGHQHADALRIVGKEILRDLWLAAGGGAA